MSAWVVTSGSCYCYPVDRDRGCCATSDNFTYNRELPSPSVNSGIPRWCSGKESACQYRRCGFHPWVGKIPWRRAWQPAPVFFPGESHGQRSLVGYSPWGHTESDPTEVTEHSTAHQVSTLCRVVLKCYNSPPLKGAIFSHSSQMGKLRFREVKPGSGAAGI